ncbi:pre-B-cell leukemia transcription factor-interacting protein 1 isoform X3 [Felis catus]|uniref:pre-B-cell leukemia transcription factor-interacting protein 1 isoform X3 n=2 Tax=Felis catus TaxID=9685 RepID=UPI001D1A16DE|nr:pre-B-cell leukemia transcription factor-interacting protein 1 isoform X3 [Felis catus]
MVEILAPEVTLVAATAPSGTPATMASCPDSDNSWVLAGSEHPLPQGLPVETLGPESRMDPEPEKAPQAPRSHFEAAADELAGAVNGEETPFQTESPQCGPVLPEKTEAKGVLEGDGCATKPPGLGDMVVQRDLEEAPVVAGPEDTRDTQDLEGHSPPQSLPSSPNAGRASEDRPGGRGRGPSLCLSLRSPHCLVPTAPPAWPAEEARRSSSEDDTDADVEAEGLRRRRGREPSTPRPVEGQARGEGAGGEPGFSPNMCLLGALVLLGLGILLFCGGLSEFDSGPTEEAQPQAFPDTGSDAEDGLGQPLQASAPPDRVPSLQSMALLLDKLAKENQDIRLLQAQLQAQKEELQSLVRQPRELEEENARLRGALRRGEAAQRSLESELQRLRAGCVRGPDGVCVPWSGGSLGGGVSGEWEPGPGLPEQQERLEAEAQALRRELERQRRLLGAVRQDLEQSLSGAGRGDLAELGRRLAQKLQGLEKWGQHPGVGANASEAGHREPRFQSPREWSGKEKRRGGQGDRSAEPWRHKKEGSGRERKKWGGEGREMAEGWGEGKPQGAEWGSRKDARRQGPEEPPRKSGSPHPPGGQQRPQREEGASDGRGRPAPAPAPAPWAELLRRKYRAPQGCSGVRECARQEGLAFGAELAPVRRQELASLLTTYLARLPWAGQLTQELPLSLAYFGEDGIFRHDRLRFRDFVDALEDSLEEVAVRQTGDDDEVDDFEGFIFSHFFGDKALKKRSGKKDRHFRSPGRG